MNKNLIIQALNKARETSQKRKFKQSVELIINFRDLDLKKPEHQLEMYIQLHKPKEKKIKICGLVGPELHEQAKQAFDNAILIDDFEKYTKDKKSAKKIAREYDFFIAQANIMPKIAAAFGKYLAPIGKMPNPKAGCIVPPNANLTQLNEKLQKTVKVSVKKDPLFQTFVGYEDTKEEEIIDNIETIYNQVESHLPNEKRNIRSVYVKLTMGPAVKIGEEVKKVEDKQKKTLLGKKLAGDKKEDQKETESKEEKPPKKKEYQKETESKEEKTAEKKKETKKKSKENKKE